jgi:hypothetical protein
MQGDPWNKSHGSSSRLAFPHELERGAQSRETQSMDQAVGLLAVLRGWRCRSHRLFKLSSPSDGGPHHLRLVKMPPPAIHAATTVMLYPSLLLHLRSIPFSDRFPPSRSLLKSPDRDMFLGSRHAHAISESSWSLTAPAYCFETREGKIPTTIPANALGKYVCRPECLSSGVRTV